MAKTESVTAQMQEILETYDKHVAEVAEKSAEESAKECAQKLKTTSPKGPEGYARSWTAKRVGKGWVCYNKDHYQLTHLLENSHDIVNQTGKHGRTYPGHGQIVHIYPVEQQGIEGFELRINRGLNE